MSTRLAQISFAELLAANEAETRNWRKWFDGQPASVLDIPLSIASSKNVRELLLHIFAVELRYAERLQGLPVTAYEVLPMGSIADLFGVGEKAGTMYHEYLSSVSNQDLGTIIEFPTRTAGMLRSSKRKIFLHAMLHGVRHWAQLATALREAGHPTNWAKDFLYSEVME